MWIFVDANLEAFWRYTDLAFNSPLVFERYHMFFLQHGGDWNLVWLLWKKFGGDKQKTCSFVLNGFLQGNYRAAPFFSWMVTRPWKTGFFSTNFAWTTEIAMLTWSDFHQTVERWVDFTTLAGRFGSQIWCRMLLGMERQRQQKQMNPEDNLGFIPETPSWYLGSYEDIYQSWVGSIGKYWDNTPWKPTWQWKDNHLIWRCISWVRMVIFQLTMLVCWFHMNYQLTVRRSSACISSGWIPIASHVWITASLVV